MHARESHVSRVNTGCEDVGLSTVLEHSCEQEEPRLSADPLHQGLPLTIDTRRYSERRT